MSGKIVDKKGNPVTTMKGATVEFDSVDHRSSANGAVDEKGEFRLSTLTPGDGAYLGKQRVAILRPDRGPDVYVPHIIAPKYEKFETSGLEVTVEPRENVFTLEVDLHRP